MVRSAGGADQKPLTRVRSQKIIVNHLRLTFEKPIFLSDELTLLLDQTSLLVDEPLLVLD